jgi:hypothetical protein
MSGSGVPSGRPSCQENVLYTARLLAPFIPVESETAAAKIVMRQLYLTISKARTRWSRSSSYADMVVIQRLLLAQSNNRILVSAALMVPEAYQTSGFVFEIVLFVA